MAGLVLQMLLGAPCPCGSCQHILTGSALTEAFSGHRSKLSMCWGPPGRPESRLTNLCPFVPGFSIESPRAPKTP